MRRLAIAFSGGLDSRFLCLAARMCGCDVLALHAYGPHIPTSESAGALDFVRNMGIAIRSIPFSPLSIPDVARNTRERCYSCKKALMEALRNTLEGDGEADRLLCDGSNLDDLSAYRPGLRALKEAGVRSPLAEAHLPKKTIRTIAMDMGMPMPPLGARPCLLTRYAYGLSPRAEELGRLARAEEDLAGLAGKDGTPLLRDFRLRLTPAPILQCNAQEKVGKETVEEIMRKHGFESFSILQVDSVSGFYDKPRTK